MSQLFPETLPTLPGVERGASKWCARVQKGKPEGYRPSLGPTTLTQTPMAEGCAVMTTNRLVLKRDQHGAKCLTGPVWTHCPSLAFGHSGVCFLGTPCLVGVSWEAKRKQIILGGPRNRKQSHLAPYVLDSLAADLGRKSRITLKMRIIFGTTCIAAMRLPMSKTSLMVGHSLWQAKQIEHYQY